MTFSLRSRALAAIVSVCSIAVLATGCGTGNTGIDTSEASTNQMITANITEPSNGLLPGNTSDMSGWKIVSQLYDGLVTFDTKGNEELVQAKSITPNTDASGYTIKLKPSLKFSNGEKITASTYARSWSFAANAANGQVGASIFEDIKGYDDLQDANGDKNAQLSGLDVVDDSTLKVTLKEPNSAFAYKLGDIAFLPVPSQALKDPKTCGLKPVGNGPYKLKEWKSGEEIVLERDKNYKGPRKVKNAGIDFKVYQSLDAAYSDLLAGNLDTLDSIPTSALKTYRDEKNITAISKDGPSFSDLTIPQNLKHFQGKEGVLRRRAIAHALDRESIAKAIFDGTVTPAADFLAPVIKGYDPNWAPTPSPIIRTKPRSYGPKPMRSVHGTARSASHTAPMEPTRSGSKQPRIHLATCWTSKPKAILSPHPKNCAPRFKTALSARRSSQACPPIIRILKAIWCRLMIPPPPTARA